MRIQAVWLPIPPRAASGSARSPSLSLPPAVSCGPDHFCVIARGLALESFSPFPTLLGSEAQPSPAQGRSCDLGLCTVGAALPLHSAVHPGEPPGAEERGPPGPAIWKPLDRAPVEGGLSPHPCLVPERVAHMLPASRPQAPQEEAAVLMGVADGLGLTLPSSSRSWPDS